MDVLQGWCHPLDRGACLRVPASQRPNVPRREGTCPARRILGCRAAGLHRKTAGSVHEGCAREEVQGEKNAVINESEGSARQANALFIFIFFVCVCCCVFVFCDAIWFPSHFHLFFQIAQPHLHQLNYESIQYADVSAVCLLTRWALRYNPWVSSCVASQQCAWSYCKVRNFTKKEKAGRRVQTVGTFKLSRCQTVAFYCRSASCCLIIERLSVRGEMIYK